MSDSHIISLEEVVYFVNDIASARDWFLEAFGGRKDFESEFYSSIKVGEVWVGFHPSDEKAGPGVKGQVAYWLVDDMNKAIEHLLKLGCKVYRGPITSVDSETVAQLIDPFGNALGIIEKKK